MLDFSKFKLNTFKMLKTCRILQGFVKEEPRRLQENISQRSVSLLQFILCIKTCFAFVQRSFCIKNLF